MTEANDLLSDDCIHSLNENQPLKKKKKSVGGNKRVVYDSVFPFW